MNILTLDLGSNCGWALKANGRIESGVQDFSLRRGESPGMRFIRFNKWLREFDGLDLVVFELPHHRGGAATEVLVGLSTRVLEYCAMEDIEHASCHTATLKKHATGSGRASKEDMIQAASERWEDHLDNGKPGSDLADALLLMSWALDEFVIDG